MKTEIAIDNMCQDCASYPCNALRQNDMCYDENTLVDHIEKYKWHDLRKNPYDLPNENGYYLCAVNSIANPHRVLEYAPFELQCEDSNIWRCRESYAYNRFVIAWRHIEPFKEGQNDKSGKGI